MEIGLLIFFILFCALEVLCLVGLLFAARAIHRWGTLLVAVKDQIYVLKKQASSSMGLVEIGASQLMGWRKILGKQIPWWFKAFLFGMRLVAKRSESTALSDP